MSVEESSTEGYQEVRPIGWPDLAQRILHHEAAHARAGIHRGQDEDGLEHDGEVVPERHQALAEGAC